MLRSLRELEKYTVRASDGDDDIGSVANFFLDDESWTIRYLVVDTVQFMDGRQVLISPISFRQVDWPKHRFHLSLAMADIQDCPSTDMDKPVSRQHEQALNQHYGYPSYWWSSGVWGTGDLPAQLATSREDTKVAQAAERAEKLAYDVHLRSTNALRGYHIQGKDEAIGHVDDFIIDDETWEVRYLVIDTSNWWFGKKVLIAPQWAHHISWEEKVVHVDLSRATIQDSPEWDPAQSLNREYEARLYKHFGRPAYWRKGARKK